MGKKKHKKAPASVKQKDVQVENTQQTSEQETEKAQATEAMPVEQDVQPDATEQENLQVAEEQVEENSEGNPEGLTEELSQENAVPGDENLQEQEVAADEVPEQDEQEDISQEQSQLAEEVLQEQAEPAKNDVPEPEVQIKEWQESNAVAEDAEAVSADDEKAEKKTKILQWVGLVMLLAVVGVGIAIGIAGKDRESVPVNSGAVTTSTPAADATDEKEQEATLTGTPVGETELSKAPSATPTITPTVTAEPSPTATPIPSPTKAPTSMPTTEPTKAPTATPVITQAPIVVGDLDVSKYAGYSNKAEGWGIGKNTDHQQPTAWGYDEKYKFDEVGAWYVDKNATEDDKVIYLTFNCGYEVGYTPGFLEVLKKHDVKASWFVLEEYIRQCPEEIRWLMENGHLVGSHSAYHLNYGTSSPEAVIKDMLKNEQRMRDYVGLEMHKIMRPPSGYYNEQTLRIMKDMGYKIYFWSLAYPDWDPNDQPSEEYILNYFKANHHNGAIPVIHITSGNGMKVLDEVLTMLKAEGYRFGLVSEIE